jgi:integrase
MSPDYGDGGIDERGEGRRRLRYRVNAKRHTKTVRGSVTEAKRELRRLLTSRDDGAHVAPDKLPLAAPVDVPRLEFIWRIRGTT